MKLTQETLKQIVKEELEKTLQEQERANLSSDMTAGELIKAVKAAIYVKQKGIAKDQAKSGIAKMGWAVLDTLAPIVGPAIRGAGEMMDVFKAVYDLPDDKKTKTALDFLNVDDQVSAVVDNNVENAFLKYFVQRLSELPPDQMLSGVDINTALSVFIRKKYNSTKLEKGG